MKKDLKELQDTYMKLPLHIGDYFITNNGEKIYAFVDYIENDIVYYTSTTNKKGNVAKHLCIKDCTYIGYNPFVETTVSRQLNITIESLLYYAGYNKNNIFEHKIEKYGSGFVDSFNFSPYIIDKNNNKIIYQRDLVWLLEDKQSLISSIYNNIEIGRIIVKSNNIEEVYQKAKTGETSYMYDVVDGKQRINCIIDFCCNKFPDINGMYYRDLSIISQRKFNNYTKFSFFELPENVSDKEIKNTFLSVNFSGKPQSKEHIEYVKNIETI